MMNQEAILARPGRIKAFGILHMVFGILTLLIVVGGFALQPLVKGMYRTMAENAATDAERAQAEMQLKFQEDLSLYNSLSYGMLFVLAAILVVAGLFLLKGKRSGQSLSITWSWLALAGTVIWVLMAFVMVVPKMPDLMGTAMEQGLADSGATMSEAEKEKAMEAAQTVSTVMVVVMMIVCAILAAIYPLVSLVMLKKKDVSDWMAQYGT